MDISVISLAVLNIFSLLIVFIVLYFVFFPTPLTNAFIKQYDLLNKVDDPRIETDILENPFASQNFSISRYIPENADWSRVIIEIPGGAFVASAVNFDSYFAMKLPYPVYIIEYPVLFKFRAKDTYKYLQFALEYTVNLIKDKHPNCKFTLVGTSAGAFYSALIIQHEPNTFDSFISICGYFGYSTVANKLCEVIQKFYLKSGNLEPNIIPATVEYFPITADFDFLNESTKVFAERNGKVPNIYSGRHTFFVTGTTEAERAREDFKTFISNL